MHKSLLPFAAIALLSVVANAAQVRVPVNTNTSTMRLELCADPGIGQQCDNDTSPLSGFLTVALDQHGNPTQIALRNFDLRATEPFNLELRWLFGLASVDAVASGLRIYHSRPGAANPSVPVTGNAFTFTAVPFLVEGTANYVLGGLACGAVAGPCSSNLNLSTLGENSIDTLSGTLQIGNGILTVNLDFTFSTPLDDSNPGLGVMDGRVIVHASTPISLALVPPNSDWKYLDDGSNQGAGYILPPPQFDDTAWPVGPAQLGYGDGDEETVLSFGPNAATKPITTYYRHHFNVPDAGIYTNLALRVLSDDGVIVYLNGTEVYRANMPADDFPSYLAPATVAVGGAAETVFFAAPPIDPFYLINGANLIAAEIHQSAANSSDISFDLELLGNGVFPASPPAIAITSPTNNSSLTGSSITLQVNANDLDGLVTLVEFYEGSTKIGEATGAGPGYSFTWPNACAGAYIFTARATDNDNLITVSAPVVVAVTRPSLILPGATWKYLDNGTVPAAAWRSNLFNDAAWLSGPAQLGFGDGDEGTVLNRTNANGTTNISFYFRRAFTVANPATVSMLSMRVMRDDGVVVYLNGAEVFRNNMPAGTPTATTLALTNATTFEESNFTFTVSVPTALLVSGDNAIAAEVHQSSIGSSDLSFALALEDTSTNRPPAPVVLAGPPNNSTYPLGASIALGATATDPDGLVRRVEYYAGTNRLGQATIAPYSFVWNNAPAGLHQLTARAYDDCDAAGSSAPVTVRVGTFTMVPPGTTWRYLDNGSDQNTAWRARTFNDSAWTTGTAQLGYGDTDEITLINGGPTTNRFITTYFRRTFEVTDPAIVTGLVARVLRDDGAVGYINGTEVFRSNMPTGAVNHLTLAPLVVGGADENTFFPVAFANSVLLPGLNVLAVEIHQQATNSSDVSFDLELVGLVGPVEPRLTITPGAGTHQLRWPSAAAGFRLQFSADISSPANWQHHPGVPADDGAWKTILLPNTPPARFYRLGP